MDGQEFRQIDIQKVASHPAVLEGQPGAGPHRRYLFILALPCLIVAAYLALAYLVLTLNREQLGPVEAANLQVDEGGLYGSALFYRPGPYKLGLYARTNPDVAVVGSSRSLEFRSLAFAAPMVNLGGNAAVIAEASALTDRLLEIHKPKLLILTIDYWWFNQARSDDSGHSNELADTSFSLQDLLKPVSWIAEGSATPLGLLLPPRETADGGPLIGVFANQGLAGFDRDGAYHYGDLITGTKKSDDAKFKSTLKRIAKARAGSKLSVNAPFTDEMWQQFTDLTGRIRNAGVELVLVIPPVAPPVAAAMEQQAKPLLIDALRERLRASGQAFYDFHDPASLGTTECEFIDGYHGGEVTALRMVRAIANGFGDRPDLQALIKPMADLSALIDANAGHAAIAGPPLQGKEVDFLKLGCTK